jgi:hypothetical protein
MAAGRELMGMEERREAAREEGKKQVNGVERFRLRSGGVNVCWFVQFCQTSINLSFEWADVAVFPSNSRARSCTLTPRNCELQAGTR